MRKNFAEKIREGNGGEAYEAPKSGRFPWGESVKHPQHIPTVNEGQRRFIVVRSIKFIDIPEEEANGSNAFYVELPDGYRLKYENGKYAGRYDPNGTEA